MMRLISNSDSPTLFIYLYVIISYIVPVTPPSYHAELSVLILQNRALSPGSPTARQMPLTDVFEASSTEEDITGQQGRYVARVYLLLSALIEG
jgi:hypothetical protein